MDMSKSGVVASSDSGAFTDLNRLNKLKVGDRESDGNMRKVAQEFESLFLNEMLKSMRSANEVLGKDNPLNTPAAKQYQEMYDQQLSVTLSRQGGGIGLADVLMRQMSKNKAAVPGEAAATTALTAEVKAPAATTVDSPFVRSSGQRPLWASRVATTPAAAADGHKNDMAMLNQRRLALPSKLTDRLLAGIVPSADPARTALNTATVPGRTSPGLDAVLKGSRQPMLSASGAQGRMQIYGRAVAQPPLAPAKQAFESPDAFVATMLPMAQQAADRIGVDPLYLVAQAALETGWGKSVMRQQDGSSSHNLFGIKATGSWQGAQARAITSEFKGGQMVKETADFRSYDSYQDSFHDLVTLLQSNNRYKDVLNAADKPEQFVRELQKAGYATDPEYASKISQIAKQMKTYQSYASTGSLTNL
ncbi:flagellar assembly peptidoglycan hydrolase FlgJ [Pseudomonas fragi]|uniref:flagellar assembly peptidoglycan hydrolase FlgJ n=1 Tax=Pseudomonas fragi TaxID=296 RepID=UPI000A2A08CC|nr:flagellar assembly peptidoglycan hydrolase FlgJ [Pseudomonas fragi]ARQ75404.1 flagellar assembly peptidoglycan hydrolase FlgJ [Pseudomonas fragi]NNA83243.1 flagellar assembly peptidoglycan hydrolase FlgJ [Pseudomonas fragi]NNB12812.1 flagellar assembly peptidoglycan hydrolase FlgJ [Pseudomonas fragi]NNB32330.1 flagellar assembly peptidoglycan hydrolase FlgJ [Pseudomonas fragi]NNB40698.1 flagellar assembly peptidoglycan hydrolase FlgJ [Pseudomonas fragi]